MKRLIILILIALNSFQGFAQKTFEHIPDLLIVSNDRSGLYLPKIKDTAGKLVFDFKIVTKDSSSIFIIYRASYNQNEKAEIVGLNYQEEISVEPWGDFKFSILTPGLSKNVFEYLFLEAFKMGSKTEKYSFVIKANKRRLPDYIQNQNPIIYDISGFL